MAEPIPFAVMPPPIRKIGLGYRADFADDVTFVLDRLRESRGEITGELSVCRGADSYYRGRFNASSLTARVSTGRYLQQRGGGEHWLGLLEQLCHHVLDGERHAPVIETVGTNPSRASAPRFIEPVIPAGVATILFGPGGGGKSTTAAALATTGASGHTVIPGWTVRTPGPVLVVDWESSAEEWNDRLRAIARGVGIAPVPIAYIRAERPLVDMIEVIAAEVAERGIVLLIIDSVGLAAGTARDGGDASETAMRMFAALRCIGTTSLLVDHVRGDDMPSDRTGTRPYGSVYKWNLARSVIEVRRETTPGEDGAELLLLHRKANDGRLIAPTGLRLVHDDDAIRFSHIEVSAPELEQHAGSTADRMARRLRSGAMTDSDLATDLGVSPSTVRSALKRHPNRFRRLDGGRIGLAA